MSIPQRLIESLDDSQLLIFYFRLLRSRRRTVPFTLNADLRIITRGEAIALARAQAGFRGLDLIKPPLTTPGAVGNIDLMPCEAGFIRSLSDFDLTMFLSEFRDHGWDQARKLLDTMQMALNDGGPKK